MPEARDPNVKDLTLEKLLGDDSESIRTLSFDEILVEALIANTALARTLPRSLASDALKKRIEALRQEARRRDTEGAKAFALLEDLDKIERTRDELMKDTDAKKARRRARKKG